MLSNHSPPIPLPFSKSKQSFICYLFQKGQLDQRKLNEIVEKAKLRQRRSENVGKCSLNRLVQLVLLFDAYFSVGFEVALEHLVDGKLGLLATIAQSQVELNERRVLLHRLLDLLASVL